MLMVLIERPLGEGKIGIQFVKLLEIAFITFEFSRQLIKII